MNPSIKKQVVCFAAVCLALSFGYVAWRRGVDLEKLFGGPENLKVIQSPDKVEVWQTVGFLKSSEAHDLEMSDYRKKGGTPLVVPDSVAKSLSRTLSHSYSYYSDRGSAKSCIALPGFVLGFTRGDREVDVFLCFECDIILVQVGETFKTEADFDPSHNDLLGLMKVLYPKDEKIQNLRERRRR